MSSSLVPSLLALAVAGVALFVAWNQSTAAPLPPGGEGLEARIAQVEHDLDRLREDAAQAAVPAPATGAPPAEREAAVDHALRERLERLEQQVQQLARRAETARGDPAIPLDPAAAERRRQQAEADLRLAIQQWTDKFLDPRQTEAARLAALGHLRSSGPGARGGAVAAAAIALVQTSPSAEARADVWRQMSGAREPMLVPHLVTSLQTDPDRRVREEAAETLGDYNDLPEVQAALRAASEGDAEQGVRREAMRSLGRTARDRR
jgi:hypothetical protein